MDRKKSLFSALLLSLLCIGSTLADPYSLIERKKTIVKVYDVSSKDNLLIDNQFGNVTINLWNRDEIRVDVTVTANSSSDERTQQYLDAVDIIEKRNGDQISLRTQLGGRSHGNWVNIKSKNGEKNFIQIDYHISMPKSNALSVKNQFGDTNIPTFRAPLTVVSKHGGFYATTLNGNDVDIDVQFGKAEIGEMMNGKLNNSYSSLHLDKANAVVLHHQFGQVRIDEITKLDGKIGYAGAQIGSLKESCKIRLDFSKGFRIDQLPKSADNIDIDASYSSVSLPLTDHGDYNFEVTVSYGNFRYPQDGKLILTAQPSDDQRHGPRMTKQYNGKVGKGTGTKVRVISTFGDVKFQ